MRTGICRYGNISVITLIEVMRGVEDSKQKRVKELLEESFEGIGLDNKVLEAYCKLYSQLKTRGEFIPDADLLVAASAISRDLNLISKDRHFERLKDLGLRPG